MVQKKNHRPLLRRRDRNLITRTESACGLESLRKGEKGMEADLTGSLVLSGEGLVPFAAAEFAGLYPEGKDKQTGMSGKRLRFVLFRPYFEGGVVHVGGSVTKSVRPKPEDGFDGLWELPSGRVCFRRDIPEDYLGRETPAGIYKDVRMVSATHPLSIFSHTKRLKETNKHARRMLVAALTDIEAHPTKSEELRVPFTLVAREGMLKPRFLKGKFEDVTAVTALLVDIIATGMWTLPGLEDVMTARRAGVVTAVADSQIVVRYDDDDSCEVLANPRDQIAEYIGGRVQIKTANLPVVPLVAEGEKFDSGTVLWGGAVGMYGDATDFMTRNIPADVNEQQALALLRTWAVLVAATVEDGKELYPMNFVEATKSEQIFFRPGVSRVALTKHPAKLMATESVGVKIDLFTVSHRARYWREYREKVERQPSA